MKKILLAFSGFLSFLYSYSALSQESTGEPVIHIGFNAEAIIPGVDVVRTGRVSDVPSYVKMRAGSEIPLEQFPEWMNKNFKLGKDVSFVVVGYETDRLGYEHIRYQQLYKNIPVEGAVYIAHVKNNKVASMNGNVFSSIKAVNSVSLTEFKALELALQKVNAQVYKWQIPSEEQLLKEHSNNPEATYYPKGKLVLAFKNGNYREETVRLAYKFDIYASKPLYRAFVFVDAHNGDVIFENNRIHTTDVPGTAVTAYSGNQTITADSYNGSYRLRESGRGNGIETYNLNQSTNTGSAVDFTDADNYWNNINSNLDQYATDAHWGAEKTYDFYQNLGRNSIDNNGLKLISYVHYDVDFYNAFWDGTSMTYGDGDNDNPLVCSDIIGHEITHGLTQFTANLVYQDEPGALNESFSDIFGTLIEFYAKPGAANWFMGDELGAPFRSMSNPNDYENPDTYNGTFWISDPLTDYGGVHTNSGVQNYWFYLLCMGGSGVNDNGDSFNVTGVGMDNATAIAYRNLTNYLFPTANFNDARFFAIQAATDLFGPCSPEVVATTNAWYAVGVGDSYTPVVEADFFSVDTVLCSVPATINFSNASSNGVSYSWNFGDGATDNQINPSHTYTNFGNYTVTLITNGGSCGSDTHSKTQYIRIDPLNTCETLIPDNGNGTIQTSCTGILTDNGRNSNYYDNTDGTITIAPAGATQVILNFSSFEMEDGYDYLEIYDGPDVFSPLIGQYTGNMLPNGGTVSSSVTANAALTVRMTSDYMVNYSGFRANWSCNSVPVPLTAAFIADTVFSCSGNVHFYDLTQGNPTSWLWNFGDGITSSIQNPVHAYSSDGTYTVSLTVSNANGPDTHTKFNYISVSSNNCNITIMPTTGIGTTQTKCTGVLYDNGGPANYTDNTNGVLTIAPANATQVVLNFTAFGFESGYDFLTIYDGPTTSSPLIGQFTGYSLPYGGTVTSSGAALTLVQSSDFSVNTEGFVLSWSCTENINPSGVKDADNNAYSISIFPNPAKDFVVVRSNETIKKVEVYNVIGQMLYEQASNNKSVSIDIKNLPGGTYFIRVVGSETITKELKSFIVK